MFKRISFIDLFGILLLLVLCRNPQSFFGDPGIGWHLRTGQLLMKDFSQNQSLLESGFGFLSVARQLQGDPFLFPSGVGPWIHDQWFGDVLFAAIFQLGGFPLLAFFVAAILIATFIFLTAHGLSDTGQPSLRILFALLLVVALSSVQWIVRPVVFSFCLFGVTYFLCARLLKGNAQKSTFFLIPSLFLLWANLHAGFLLGLFLLATTQCVVALQKGFKECFRRENLLVFLLACLTTMINPWGYELHRNIWRLGTSRYFTHLNDEWLSPDFLQTGYLPFIGVLCAVAVFGRGRLGQQLSLFEKITFFVLAFLSLQHRRYLPFFSITAAAPLYHLLPTIGGEGEGLRAALYRLAEKEHRASFWGYFGIFSLAFVTFLFCGPNIQEQNTPLRFADVAEIITRLEDVQNGARIFHGPDLGGTLTWYHTQKGKVYIDDRNQLLGNDAYEEFATLALLQPGWDSILKKYNFQYVALEKFYPLTQLLKASPEWEILSLPNSADFLLFRHRSSISQ